MSLFLTWLGVMFPLVFSPGPANIVFAASGAKVGVKRSIALIAGVDSVFLIKSIIIGYGLGELVQSHPAVMNVMQLLGSAYLIYLAIKFLKSSQSTVNNEAKELRFVDGLIIQLLNSKGWLMVFLMFTLFSEPSLAAFGEYGVVVLIAWLAMLNILTHFAWVAIGELISKVSSNPTYEKSLNWFYAGCLIVVSVWLVVDNPMIKGLLQSAA
ncbi:LysE family translocator [Vibrio sp. 10N.261.55.A7]|uniref:LysE family translocator n=1 Tax=Vibrio sp. 10N.261.55.A7 TaxID=1880851 RepID=UPI000C82A067|nr:LysE family translocator [Vibrio sp. 10N.261.55.A7]PMJ91722.1 threonine transporter [Vibrio sp. 10N.261.55.A7]